MVQISTLLSLVAASASIVAAAPAAAPAPTAAPDLAKRATCTFSGSNGAAQASKSKASCATIVLSNVAVPSGTTLDRKFLENNTLNSTNEFNLVTKLTTGTHVNTYSPEYGSQKLTNLGHL
jgi:Flp pilus assembly protein CpaB